MNKKTTYLAIPFLCLSALMSGCLHPEDPQCEWEVEAYRMMEAYETFTEEELIENEIRCVLDFRVDFVYDDKFNRTCGDVGKYAACLYLSKRPRIDNTIVVSWYWWDRMSDEAR